MPEKYRLYLDQMFRAEVAQVLRQEGYKVIAALFKDTCRGRI